MINLPDEVWVAGVDGCKGGWVVALGQVKGETKLPFVVSTIREVFTSDPKPSIVAIDVPIGLPTYSPAGGRKCEPTIRTILRGKASSVFRVPCRDAIYAGLTEGKLDRGKYEAAKTIAKEKSTDKKGFSLQSFYIFDKIAAVDRHLLDHQEIGGNVYEAHPELTFHYMKNGIHALPSKKTPKGITERNELLRKAGIPSNVIEARPLRDAKPDDALDALACLVTARRIALCLAKQHPENPCRDDRGLPMAIWA
ncbi:MAG: DUF429 domain-containing protein [Pseudolabrys sp.]|jgi:predicted RNase H-like nuclease